MLHVRTISLIMVIGMSLLGCRNAVQSSKDADLKLATNLEKSLKENILSVWYPLSIDSVHGGFLSNFNYDWQPTRPHNKMLVTQTRHIWTCATAATFLNDDRYKKYADHGIAFLREVMWDNQYGGFYMLRTREGKTPPYSYQDEKRSYGISFAIYALAAHYDAFGDSSALNLAIKTFRWLDAHAHDAEFSGYFDHLNQDGSLPSLENTQSQAWDRGMIGMKDQNSTIHLLEAFTALYAVWPDAHLRERLREMLQLVRDVITTEKGYLTLYLTRNWTPVSYRDSTEDVRSRHYALDHVSFGHDVETAFLMLEASHVLGLENDQRTLAIAQKMVDHALATGWDEVNGGLYYEGYYYKGVDTLTVINKQKNWWVQAEALNAFLMMAQLFPEQEKYKKAFHRQWNYINTYLIDHEHGGWFIDGLDQNPDRKRAPKGSDWKINYHNTRAMINCIKMLRDEHDVFRASAH